MKVLRSMFQGEFCKKNTQVNVIELLPMLNHQFFRQRSRSVRPKFKVETVRVDILEPVRHHKSLWETPPIIIMIEGISKKTSVLREPSHGPCVSRDPQTRKVTSSLTSTRLP